MKNKVTEEMQKKIVSGPILKTLFMLSWPIMATHFFQIAYNLIDTYWLGRVSVEAVAAPTLAWPMVFLLISVAGGLSVAGVALVSQYVGANDEKEVKKSAGQVITLLTIVGVIVSTLGILASDSILQFIGAEQEVMDLASPYIKIIFASMPWMFVIMSYSFILRGWGDTRTPMYISALSVGLNIILDPVMIFGVQGLIPSMGVTGAAVATFISRTVGGVLALYLLFNAKKTLSISRSDLKVEKEKAKQIFKIGIPASIGQALVAFGFVVMVGFVARAGADAMMGKEIIAAYGIGTRIISIIFVIIGGLTGAAITMIGQNLGAGKPDRAAKTLRMTILSAMLILFACTFTFFVFRAEIYGVFIDDAVVIEEGGTYLTIFGLSTMFFGVYASSLSAFQGSGQTVPTMILGFVRLWLMRIPFSFLLAFQFGYGIEGLWWGMALSNVTSAAAALAWVSLGRWKKAVIDEPPKVGDVEGVL
ncbi:MAG: MATE family efflux transporter [Thermoplasmata archaeon]|nr:MATE family efflux transporter [Thermoplasmata archaeon]